MRICIPIMARNTEEAVKKILRANELADILELRLDAMESFRLGPMMEAASRPVIATYRSVGEGGRGSADPETRARYLFEAIEAGAAFVDVESAMPLEIRKTFFRVPRTFKIILSDHMPGGTPGCGPLEDKLRRLAAVGSDLVKIVTRARSPEENLRVLHLVPMALEMGVGIIAFCMGPLGRMSRIAATLLGGYMTFACLERGDESAEGQIPADEMRRLLEILNK